MSPRDDARRILAAAVAAADARAAVLRALALEGDALLVAGEERIPLSSVERVWVIGAGKAAGGMALAAREVLGERIAGGTITTKHGHAAGVPEIEVWEAAHPVPDASGLAGAADALDCARAAGPNDLVLCLLSGGASALWPSPPAGVSLTDLAALTDRLLRAGATIRELNAVRKHLSRIGGGWLARAAHPARVVTLAVSDVVGSPLDVITSGPTVPDPTTFADALDVIERYEVTGAPTALAWLRAGAEGRAPETPKPGDPAFARASAHVIAGNADALRGAAAEAEQLGWRAEIVADDLEGEARAVAGQIAAYALEQKRGRGDGAAPLALLLGGETTVTVRGSGTGGRNQELALALAMELDGVDGIVAASLGTDGTDGPTDAAGGIIDGETVARAAALGLDARDHLERNDAHPFLRATGDLLVTGPTGTNVCDVVLLLIQ
ncbi:MAG: glycerate kinase [Longimicrobiaceae bacterium]